MSVEHWQDTIRRVASKAYPDDEDVRQGDPKVDRALAAEIVRLERKIGRVRAVAKWARKGLATDAVEVADLVNLALLDEASR